MFQFQKTQTTHLIFFLDVSRPWKFTGDNILSLPLLSTLQVHSLFTKELSINNNRSSERQMAERHMKDAQHCNHQGNANQRDITSHLLKWLSLKKKNTNNKCSRGYGGKGNPPTLLVEMHKVIVTVNCNYCLVSMLMEKAMAPHPSTLAWKIPWTEEPGGLQSKGSLRVRHD